MRSILGTLAFGCVAIPLYPHTGPAPLVVGVLLLTGFARERRPAEEIPRIREPARRPRALPAGDPIPATFRATSEPPRPRRKSRAALAREAWAEAMQTGSYLTGFRVEAGAPTNRELEAPSLATALDALASLGLGARRYRVFLNQVLLCEGDRDVCRHALVAAEAYVEERKRDGLPAIADEIAAKVMAAFRAVG